MAADVECVFHSDRYLFDSLVRDLRKAGLVKSAHAKVMAMAVCSCRKKALYRQPYRQLDVCQATDHVMTSSTKLWSKLSASSSNLVMTSAHIAQRFPMTSQGRLILVISQALQGHMTLLEEEKQAALVSKFGGGHDSDGNSSTNVGNKDSQEKTTPGKKQKLRQDQIKKIISKKKRRCQFKSELRLPVFGGNTSAFYNNAAVGPNFCRLCVRHTCVVELDWEKTRQLMDQNKQTTVVQVWCPSFEVLECVRKELTTLAVTIQRAATSTWEVAKEEQHQRKMARQQLCLSDDSTDWLNRKSKSSAAKVHNPLDWKDLLSRDFELKQTKQRGCRASRPDKKPVKLDDGSTFVAGHCLHCLMPFQQFYSNGATGTCCYHPGYKIKIDGQWEWTCCNKLSDRSPPTHAEHACSGCQDTTHTWRPHKRASRKTWQKSDCNQEYHIK